MCTVLSIKKPPDLDPPNSTATSTNPPTTKTTSKTSPTTTTKTTTKITPSTTPQTTTKRTTSSTWDPPTTTVIYDEPGDCDFESDCGWKSSTTGMEIIFKVLSVISWFDN